MKINNIGNLKCLHREDVYLSETIDIPDFLIKSTAQALNNLGGRNWIPVIVKEIGIDKYEVIGNSFIYEAVKESGLEKIWCIIADNSKETATLTKFLSGEVKPKVNLSHATRDEIRSVFQYLIETPGSVMKSVKISVATNRIDEAPRKYWKSLEPITTLKCGITKGVKLNALKEVFELTPEPLPEVIKDPTILITLTVTELKKMASKRAIPGCGRKSKVELIKLLSQ